jgi:hypothetical protein
VVGKKFLGPRLDFLCLENCSEDCDTNLLALIADQCHELQFSTMVAPPFATNDPVSFEYIRGQLPRLERLNSSANTTEFAKFLKSVLGPDQVVNILSTTIFDGNVDEETEDFFTECLRAMDSLHNINIAGPQRIAVEDKNGRPGNSYAGMKTAIGNGIGSGCICANLIRRT